MAERLGYIRLQPARILDLGCGHGADLQLLHQHYPQADYIGLDFALPMLQQAENQRSVLSRLFGKRPACHRLCGNAIALPLSDNGINLVWSNLLLNWLSDPMPAIREMHRVLAVDGMLMFSTLGPDTLKELRAALPSQQGERVHRFIDMHDLGDCLVQAGFSDPVMDMQTLTLTYTDIDHLFTDLRQSGCNNAARKRPNALSGRQAWKDARTTLENSRVTGRFPVTIELIFGHAWKPAPRQIDDGREIIHFHPHQKSLSSPG